MKASHDIFHAKGFGKVAPWVDLANSEEWDGFGKLTDHLANPLWLATFLKHWKLHSRLPKQVPRRELLPLRALLRRAAEKFAAGQSLSRAELSKLNRALKVPACQRFVENQNGFRAELVPLKPTWNWVIARIAASLGEMLQNRGAKRIKTCANSGCRWVFYDTTKARTRCWCNDRTCGNRARVRRARRAHRRIVRKVRQLRNPPTSQERSV
jgi:predicted RNA-binding Zn ribbon-like protein